MNSNHTLSKGLAITLWAAQILLSGLLLWAAAMKLFLPAVKLATMWPWTLENRKLVVLTGVLDALAGLGLVLPRLLNIKPPLTFYAACGIIALMIAAMIFHISRGEASLIGFNVFMLIAAAFIAWGRR
jgi:hypothetical protein